MNIDIYAAGCAVNQKGVKEKSSACAIILVATDGKRTVRRAMTFPLKNSTVNLAALQAARLGLLSMKPGVLKRGYQVVFHTDSRYVIDLVEKVGGAFKVAPKANQDVVEKFRAVYNDLDGIAVGYGKFDEGIGNECLLLARGAAATQIATDSGTREYDPQPG